MSTHRRGNSLVVLAWRNLWRNRRRTLITLSSIVFGVFLAVLMTAMQDRNWAEMIDHAARLGGGHVTLQHPEYLDSPTVSRIVTGVPELERLALDDPRVVRTAARVVGPVMLATALESFGAGFVAFDPRREDPSTLAILDSLSDGEIFTDSDGRGIVLGAKLAKNLGAEVGDKVVYTTTDRHGEITSGLARVSGLVTSGAPSLDASLCLLPLDAARRTLGLAPDEATQVAVFVDDHRDSEIVARRLAEEVGPRIAALPWDRARPELAAFIAAKVGGARFMEVLIAILVAAGIFNTLFVSVMERQREFGIMIAIGWPPGKLFRLVMLESLWLGLIGLVTACLITAGPYTYLSRTGIDVSKMLANTNQTEIAGVAMSTTLKIGIYPESATIIAVFALLAVMLSGLYPAVRAGRVDPVDVIRLV